MNNRKHLKNLRFKTKHPKKYKNLKVKPIFKYLVEDCSYKLLLGEVLLLVVREINEEEHIKEEQILKKIERFEKKLKFEEAFYGNQNIPFKIKAMLAKDLSFIKKNRNKYSDFKGEVLEYFVIFTEKNKLEDCKHKDLKYPYKIRLEPEVKYKRKSLLNNNFPGCSCDVDIISVDSEGVFINLVECKFHLDGNLIQLNNHLQNYSIKITRKINYIENLEDVLSEFKSDSIEKINVRKRLVSMTDVKENMPSQFEGYELLELPKEYREMVYTIKERNV